MTSGPSWRFVFALVKGFGFFFPNRGLWLFLFKIKEEEVPEQMQPTC
jgi:hypothetical protein